MLGDIRYPELIALGACERSIHEIECHCVESFDARALATSQNAVQAGTAHQRRAT
jgi:hypothetical protein